MKQLNNNNGSIIKIVQININTNRIIYKIFENIVLQVNEGQIEIVKEFLMESKVIMLDIEMDTIIDNLTANEYIENFALNKIKNLENDNYEVSEDSQNWLFSERAMRIVIDNAKSNAQLVQNANYRALIDGIVQLHNGYIKVGEKNVIIYVNEVAPEHGAIIQDFIYDAETNPEGWIYLENKI